MNRMNASEVIKAKQNRILYNTYYTPTVLESSVTSTVRPISSVIRYTSAGINILSTSYTSCVTTCNTYVAKPTFVSYEMLHAMRDGEYGCDAPRRAAETRWNNTTTVQKIIQSTLFSSFSTTGPLLPSSVRYSSSLMTVGPTPVICPLIDYHQGTSFSTKETCQPYPNQSGYCCE
jgi:hypothetical protein